MRLKEEGTGKRKELTFIHPSVRTVEGTLVTWVAPVYIPDPRDVIQAEFIRSKSRSSQHAEFKK